MSLQKNGIDHGGRRLALVALVVLALMLGACAQSGTESDDGAAPSQAGDGNESRQGTEQGTVVAEANGPAVEVFDAPDAPAPRLSLSNPTDNGGPRVFLVKERRGGWLNVALPVRPNGSTGWVREGDVTLSSTPYRITVDLAGHQITVWEGDQVIVDEPVGVGKKDAPTPGATTTSPSSSSRRIRPPSMAPTPSGFRASPTSSPTSPAGRASSAYMATTTPRRSAPTSAVAASG